MATKIRLARNGRKKKPHYSIVVISSRRAREGKYIEKLGTYSPLLDKDDENRIVIKNQERVKYWLGVGAIPSSRVVTLLKRVGMA